ncbi:MAG: M57 family metalloprotease [Nocardioides sp.]
MIAPHSLLRGFFRALVCSLVLALAAVLAPASAGALGSATPAGPTEERAHPAPVVKHFDDHDSLARLARVRRWPRGPITYFDATRDSGAVKQAVQFWNQSGAKVRFKKIKNKRRADLLIRNSKRVPFGCGTGLATLGFTGRRQAYVNILHGKDADGQTCAEPGQTLVLTHELGHVLGLGHDDSKCSIMNSYHVNGVAPGQCFTPDQNDFDEAPGRWRCRGPEKSDIKRVKRMYGGKVKVRQQEWCELGVRMPATGLVSAVPLGNGQVQVTARHEPEPVQPGWLAASAPGAIYQLTLTPGDCAAPAGAASVAGPYTWGAAAGTDEVFTESLTAGPWCVTVLAYDTLRRPAITSSSVTVPVS